MKELQWKILMILVFVMTSAMALAQPSLQSKTIHDSLEVLKNAGGFVDGYSNPATAEETRYHNIALMLFTIPYKEARNILSDNNKFAKCYGFSIIVKMYFDSLTKKDLEIFKDSTSLPLYTNRGIIDAGFTTGKYCEMAYNSVVTKRMNAARKPTVIAAVKSFIKGHAKFPGSYQPLDFKNYLWGGPEQDIYYQIKHLYKIKQKNGKLVMAEEYFLLDKNYTIMLIETKRSNSTKVDPPDTAAWMRSYGKE